ncbi:NUDIX hydrolase [Streptomyces sp. BH-SS-21]|uniref:NUDIX hydrolase n=1 Tax=Streptomyces liliiviolaceus TaxID=2823109 RepID=A0A940Y3S0_9ACTN|nr:NUDIX domain-containing protein [Streptomyces liliiviolaceus]MBQ0850089.1 NUDIX hydrolase [Streptomyces liliiviolaceus]
MEGYDKHAFEPFAVTVDLAVFTVRAGALQVLLIERGQEPYAGCRALPGGFVLPKESAGTAARRELAEETGLTDVSGLHLEQLRTYSEPDRDPRMRVVSVAYAALLPDAPEPRGGGDAASAHWLPYDGLGPLAFDHDRILADARERIGAKLEYTCLATAFCPPEFTLGELQQIYETVWGAALDRPNFRRKVLATPGFVEPVPGAARLTGGRGKPAALYRAGGATALHPPLLRAAAGSAPSSPSPSSSPPSPPSTSVSPSASSAPSEGSSS